MLGLGGLELLVAAVGLAAAFVILLLVSLPLALLIAIVVAIVAFPFRPRSGARILSDAGSFWLRGLRVGHSQHVTPAAAMGVIDAVGPGRIRWAVGDVTNQICRVWLSLTAGEFALLDPGERDQVLARWAGVLAGLCRDESGIERVRWSAIAAPAALGGPESWLARHGSGDPDAIADYSGLLATLAASARSHTVVISLDVRAQTGSDDRLETVLAEADHLRSALARAGITATPLSSISVGFLAESLGHPLAAEARALAEMDGAYSRPEAAVAVSESALRLRLGTQHATVLAIDEWPRQHVTGEFLSTLLTERCPGTRVLTVDMVPRPPDKALREAEHHRTSLTAEEAQKSKVGFDLKARTSAEFDQVAQREAEILAGHQVLRFTGTIALLASSPSDLERSLRATYQAASSAFLRLRKLPHRQLAALASALPVPVVPPPPSPLPLLRPAPVIDASEATTLHLRAVYPLQASHPLPPEGPAIGWDRLSGEPGCLDPWALYARHIVTSPSMLVLGEVGKGKSSFVKAFLTRQALFSRQIFVIDPKGEYAALADQIGLDLICLAPGGELRLNPLDVGPVDLEDPAPTLRARSRTASALATALLGRELVAAERAAIEAALERLGEVMLPTAVILDDPSMAQPILDDLVSLLLDPVPEMAATLSTTTDEIRRTARDLALALRSLTAGDLAGMFNGYGNVSIDWAGPGAVVDLSAAYAIPDALGPILVAATSWLSQHLAQASEVRRIVVVDEAWAVLKNSIAWLASTIKLARSLGVCVLMVVHRLSDLSAVGDDASEVAKRSQGLLSDTEIRIMFALQPAEIPLAQRVLGLTLAEASLLRDLDRGCALWQIGQHQRALVDVELTEADLVVTDTDAAMRA